MPVHSPKKMTVSILIPFLVFIIFFTLMIWQKYRSSQEIPIAPPQQSVEGGKTVTLFFCADGTRLVREAREIEACSDDNNCLKNLLEELLNGPVGALEEALPDGTLVNDVQLTGELATVDLNSVFSDGMLSGSTAEMLAVYSVVNTVAANFPGIKLIKLNIDGNSAVVLRHLDISEPLQPDYSLENQPTPLQEKKTNKPVKTRGQ